MSWNAGDALGFGWARFREAPDRYLLGCLVLVAGLVVAAVLGVLLHTTLVDVTSGLGVSLLVGALGAALVVIAAQVFGAGFLRGALGVTEGRQFQPQDVLSTEPVGRIVATSPIIAVGTFLGSLCAPSPDSRSLSSPSGASISPSTAAWAQRIAITASVRSGHGPPHRVAGVVRGRRPGRGRRSRALRGRPARRTARGGAGRGLHVPTADRPRSSRDPPNQSATTRPRAGRRPDRFRAPRRPPRRAH